jgi:hypothetical protein
VYVDTLRVDQPARPEVRQVVLVEGVSDRVALETLAGRNGRDLTAEGTVVVPMGGVTNVGRFLTDLAGRGHRVAGLCDAGEERFVSRALTVAGYGSPSSRADLERAGFFVCVADLEDELIRALGPRRVEEVLEAYGDLTRFRRFQHQPAHRGHGVEHQLRRFLGTTGGRKAAYARRLVDSMDPDRSPLPLAALLAYV